MDWNKRNAQLTFYKTYMKYLSKAHKKLDADNRRRLKQPLKLSPFEKYAILLILKGTISKIIVVNRGFNAANTVVELSTSKPPMHIRFQEPILDKLYDEETLEPLRECFKAMSTSKLETDIECKFNSLISIYTTLHQYLLIDINYVEVIRCALEICCKDIEEFGDLRNFAEFIFCENREAYDEYNLLKTCSENIKRKNELQKVLKRNHQQNEALIIELDEELFKLKTECENKEKTNRLEENMVKKWEIARQEQVDAVFNHELKHLYQTRDNYEEKTEKELIAINEIMAFYRAKCTKLKNSIKSWQQRYENEILQLDEQIKHTEETIEDVKSNYEQIRIQYEEREQFIEEYHLEQKRLEEIKKIEAGQRASAIHIQAWWRGTMVRKQLGPYRPRKKSKKQKTAKKK